MRFMDDNVLLGSDTAHGLYAACRDLPIIDYHSHLPPAEIAGNRHFSDLAELWLSGDHYKWRLMRPRTSSAPLPAPSVSRRAIR